MSFQWIYNLDEDQLICHPPLSEVNQNDHPLVCLRTNGESYVQVIALYGSPNYTNLFAYEDYNAKVGQSLTNLVYMLLGAEINYNDLPKLYMKIYEQSTTYEFLTK